MHCFSLNEVGFKLHAQIKPNVLKIVKMSLINMLIFKHDQIHKTIGMQLYNKLKSSFYIAHITNIHTSVKKTMQALFTKSIIFIYLFV